MDAIATGTGALSGILTGLLVALGLKSRIDRLENITVTRETCLTMHGGWSKHLEAIQSDISHQLSAMRAASSTEAKSTERWLESLDDRMKVVEQGVSKLNSK
jgi:hypothetical protein